MALIDREQALSHPFANGQYDKEHADEHFIMGFEDYKEWLEDLPTVEAIPKDQYENRLTTDMATIKQLSNSIKVLQKANSEIVGAYDKLKADYEARLKADMVAMLTELMVGIGDHIMPSNHTDSYDDGWSEGAEWCVDYIQEHINTLKGVEDGNK